MSKNGKIDGPEDFTNDGLMKLKLWLDPWFRRAAGIFGHVIQDEGIDLPQRGHLNFVGAGVTATDDPPGTTLVTIPGGGSGGGIVWAQAANATGYVAADYWSGRSHDPLAYHYFSTTDPTTFAFNQNDYPGPGDGEVQILRSGLYVVRLTVAPSSLTHNADPGYTWDLALQARVQDIFSSLYFGMDPAPSSVYYSGAAYGFFLSPRDNFATAGYTAPNGNSLQGAGQAQAPETAVFINLDDSVVGPFGWPVVVYNRFHHGLDNADVTVPSYALLVMRLADSNPDAPTG